MELTHKTWQASRALLEGADYTCVVKTEVCTFTATERGVKPLVRWLTDGTDLRGGFAADKVVGKATAYLYCLLGVRAVYARVMSRSAAQVLAENHIDAAWDILAEHIINRQGNGICPFEAAVLEIHSPDAALEAIRRKMEQMDIRL